MLAPPLQCSSIFSSYIRVCVLEFVRKLCVRTILCLLPNFQRLKFFFDFRERTLNHEKWPGCNIFYFKIMLSVQNNIATICIGLNVWAQSRRMIGGASAAS